VKRLALFLLFIAVSIAAFADYKVGLVTGIFNVEAQYAADGSLVATVYQQAWGLENRLTLGRLQFSAQGIYMPAVGDFPWEARVLLDGGLLDEFGAFSFAIGLGPSFNWKLVDRSITNAYSWHAVASVDVAVGPFGIGLRALWDFANSTSQSPVILLSFLFR
jgi:hypothetical protein